MRFISLVLLCSVLVGCSSKPIVPTVQTLQSSDATHIINWNDDDIPAIAGTLWLSDAETRFKNPIVFLCHGTYQFMDGKEEWVISPSEPRQTESVESLAITLHNLYPNNEIVLLICNSRGYNIDVPKVYYAKEEVWTIPDDFCNRYWKGMDYEVVGNIWGFTTTKVEPDVLETSPTTFPVHDGL